jgi:hypothetical protein
MGRGSTGALTGAAFILAAALMVMDAAFAQTTGERTVAVPPIVLKAFQQAYPGATVSGAMQEREGSRTVIRVNGVAKGGRNVSLLYDPNGTVVQIAEQVAELEVPAPVLAAMRAHRRAIFVAATRVTRGPTVEYHLTVRGSRRTRMVAKEDGTVISFQ